MRLDKIKLAGFKSFVDPTVLHFPSNLISLLGPNGCGKSNVIDAVRWVMGESSAKNLRGESLTDVIFNGSVSRKPVAQAMVELIFDNSDKKLQGEYSAFNEVSVKRVLNREGQSNYYLNKSRCRRKDITDLFLGTGLGPRSYSIIEQGMISRLIEAKPEDVRVYIEEAAGISKYKERRKETENRIKHTRENLERLEDIRHELESQLNRLQRQARTARRYTQLKQDERVKKAQLHALRWRNIEAQAKQQRSLIDEHEDVVENKVIFGNTLLAKIEQERQHQTEQNERFNQVQGRYYQLESAISRLEQSIIHQKERYKQEEKELRQSEYAYQHTQQNAEKDELVFQKLLHEIQVLEPQLDIAQERVKDAEVSLNNSETEISQWQSQWNELTERMQQPSQIAQVERAKLTHLEQSIVQLNLRQRKLSDEFSELTISDTEKLVAQLNIESEEKKHQLEEYQQLLQENQQNSDSCHKDYNQATHDLHELKHQSQIIVGKKSSLEQLQEVALNNNTSSEKQWLIDNQLTEHPNLLQTLSVQQEYENVVEMVLADYLQAICLSSKEYDKTISQLLHYPNVDFSMCLLVTDKNSTNPIDASSNAELINQYRNTSNRKVKLPKLLDFINDCESSLSFLSNIYVAESLSEGIDQQINLSANQTIVSKDGFYLGLNWLRKSQQEQQQKGVLSREKLLKTLTSDLGLLSNKISDGDRQVKLKREEEQEYKLKGQQLAQQVKQTQRDLDKLNNVLHSKQLYIQQISKRAQRIEAELEELKLQLIKAKGDEQDSSHKLHHALSELDSQSQEKQDLESSKQGLQRQVNDLKQIAKHDKDNSHRLEVKLKGLQGDFKAIQQNVERLQQQLERQKNRYEQLLANKNKNENPLPSLEADLDQNLSNKLSVTEELSETRLQVEKIDNLIRTLETDRQRNDHELQAMREKLEQSRLYYQELIVKKDLQYEKVEESDFTMQELFLQIPETAQESEWLTAIEQLKQKIKNLGNINLAAISEFDEQNERKQFLDEQNQDLVNALATLETAIAKIDRETRSRFKETFEQVNASLKELFPRLFGGGRAYLDLTSDDLLDTGVTIMAQPPGKRNNTIHLLSGGEKAMTAVALVFAIFSLNPSPFCMLDEVDAPLDEANVGRFCQMVKEMSNTIQFIFITHNKTSMEISDYLCGVTMKEPGVSRIVDVNLQEAVDLVK